MKRLNEAYEVLSDPSRKASYDELIGSLTASVKPQAAPPAAAPRPTASSSTTSSSAASQTKREEAERQFHEQRRPDSDASAGQRGYYPPLSEKKPFPWSSAFVAVVFGGAVLLAFIGRERPAPPQAPQVATPSKYPRCAGSTIIAACEKVEADLAAEAASFSRERVAKLDAERAKNLAVAYSNQKGPGPVPVEVGKTPAWPAERPATAIKPVVPIVARQRDYSCLSTVTLNLTSTNYSGTVSVELRNGTRPGSSVLEQSEVFTSGVVTVTNVCPGTYFFAFATPDSPTVSTTQYFNVRQDSEGYSVPVITVTFSRSTSPDSHAVGVASRSQL